MSLEPRQQVFVQEYLRTLNATKAALAAGYSAKTARQQASALLSKPDISAAIERAHSRTLNRYEVSRERIVAEQASIAFGSMADYTRIQDGSLVLDFSTMTKRQASVIQEIQTEVEVVTPQKRAEEGDDCEAAAPEVRVVKTKLKLYDKGRALEYLGRPFGLSNINVRLTVDDQRPDFGELSDKDLKALKGLLAKAMPPAMLEATAVDLTGETEGEDDGEA